MSCIVKDPRSRNWYVVYRRAHDRKRVKRSTGTADRKAALKFAKTVDEADRLIRRGGDIEDALRSIIDELLTSAGRPPLDNPSVAEWFARWLKNQAGAVAEASLRRYEQALGSFLRFLGERKTLKLAELSSADIERYRDRLLAEGRSPNTVNLLSKTILGAPFLAAVRQGLLTRSPVAALRSLRVEPTERGVFSPGEIARLFSAAEGESPTLVYLAYFSGARLRDCALLRWQDVSLHEGRICFRQRKTRRVIQIPITPELSEHLLTLPAPDQPDAPLLPGLARQAVGGSRGLSHQFRELMNRAGLEAGVARARDGAAGHTVSSRSFHSLRHSFVSAMMNAGVPPELRQKLTGHSSLQIHQNYSHAEWQTLAQAVGSIPRIVPSA
jgi:integrase